MFDDLQEWLQDKPQIIKDLATKFPPGTMIVIPDRGEYHVVGWNEGNAIIVSRVDPFQDYDRAIENVEYICADHILGVIGTREVDTEGKTISFKTIE